MCRALVHDPRLILPVGALEQHGAHLPLGTNIHVAQRVAHELSSRLEILCAPTFSYGATATRGAFAGAAGVGRKTLHRAVNELLARWEDDGVEQFILVTAHRHEPHLEALLMAMTGRSTNSVYDLYRIDVRDLLDSDPEIEHGGELETSLMLHLAPELVDLEQVRDFDPPPGALRKYTRGRVPAPPPQSGGVVGFPSRATAEKGAAVFDRYVRALVAELSG